MKTKIMQCPACGAPIDANVQGRNSIFCSYCGHQIYLDDEKQEYIVNKNININKTVHKRYTDDAKVIRETNKEKENKRTWIALTVCLVCLIILIGIPFGMLLKLDIEEDIAKSEGKISAGYYRDLIGENYETVEAHFKAAGFNNIQLIDLDDSGLAFWKDRKVENISVGGNTSFESTDFFEPDTRVVISFH